MEPKSLSYKKKEIIQFFKYKLINYLKLEKQRNISIHLSEDEIGSRASNAADFIADMLQQNNNKLTYEIMFLSYEILFINLDFNYATNVRSVM